MPLRQWSKTSFVVLALTLWVGVGLIAPFVVTLNSNETLGDSVEASTAGTFSFEHPVVLSTVPFIRVERGLGMFVDSAGRPLPAGTQPPASQGHVRLFNAVVSIEAMAPTATSDVVSRNGAEPALASPIAHTLAEGRYQSLSIRRSTVQLATPSGGRAALSDVTADVTVPRAGHVMIKGRGNFRGLPVQFETFASPGQGERNASTQQSRLPLRLAIKSEHIDIGLDGRLVSTPTAVWLEGPAHVSTQGARGFARWLGALWPRGSGLRDISIKGEMTARLDVVTFDKAVVRMDGNDGAGVLAIKVGGDRPVISGTLAYKSFDITPYLGMPEPAAARIDRVSWSSLAADALTVPLGRNVDADLRLSADRVLVNRLDIGPAAATVALKDGRLLADLAGFSVAGMEGGGQIIADFTASVPKVTARGKFDRVDLTYVAGLAGLSPMVQGRVHVRADLVGHGSTLQSVVDSASGRIALTSAEAGRIGVDFRRLGAAARQGDVVGWSGGGAGRLVPYEALDLRLVLKDGSLAAEKAEIKDGDGVWAISGQVNLPAALVDARVRLVPSNPQAGTAQPAGAAALAPLEIKGPLSEPRIRAELSR